MAVQLIQPVSKRVDGDAHVIVRGGSPANIPVLAGVLVGAGAPDAGYGNIGDAYLDIESGLLYGPLSTSGWGTAVFTLSAAV